MHLYCCGFVPRVKGKTVKPLSCVALQQLYKDSRQRMTCGGLSRFELGERPVKALFRAIKLCAHIMYMYTLVNEPIRHYPGCS